MNERAALVPFGDDAEDVIGDDLVEWSKAELVLRPDPLRRIAR
jgi:hypothetical protein